MKIQSKQITCYIGFAYITLAFVSLVADLPVRVVNCISLGALLISIAELILAISNLRKPKESRVSAKDLESLSDQLDLASFFLKKTLEAKARVYKSNNKVTFLVGFLYSFSFVVVIAWANSSVYNFLEWNKLGVFCTVASLGVILLSRFISEVGDERIEVERELAFYDMFNHYLDSVTKAINQATDKQNRIEHAEQKEDILVENKEDAGRSIEKKRKKKKRQK